MKNCIIKVPYKNGYTILEQITCYNQAKSARCLYAFWYRSFLIQRLIKNVA